MVKKEVVKRFDYYDLWRDDVFTTEELEASLGSNLAKDPELCILIELCPASQRYFYHKRFTVVKIDYPKITPSGRYFTVYLPSVDNFSLNMWWDIRGMMDPYPYVAKDMLREFLHKSNYFINFKGLEFFCQTMFGAPDYVDYD